MTRAYYDNKPSAFEAVGNGNYLYRWDIKEEKVQYEMMQGDEPVLSDRVQYSCREVTVHGNPEYGECVEAVIRESYSSSAELSLINQYNAYQQGVAGSANVVKEYEEYLAFVASVKDMVRIDMKIEPEAKTPVSAPKMADIAKLLMLVVNTMNLTDEESLHVKSVYPDYKDCIGKTLTVGFRLNYNNELYKILQEHTAQADWKPSELPALYGLITESHAGTKDDPIPYVRKMVLEEGKYYSQNGVTYLCKTSSGVGYDADLTELLSLLEVVK